MENRWPTGICFMAQETKTGAPINKDWWDGEGGKFKREGIYAYLWLIHVEV